CHEVAPFHSYLISMKQFLSRKPKAVLILLAFGILSTIVYDFVASNGVEVRIGGWIENVWMEWTLFAIALPFRLFTYVALFLSFPILASQLKYRKQRIVQLWMVWFGASLVLLAGLWCWVATSDTIGLGVSVKRMSPHTIAHFAPDQTLATIALGSELAKNDTWMTAIGLEVLALLIATTVVAALTLLAANLRSSLWAILAPVSSVLVLVFYNQIAPWSLDIDFDIFIGDALLGTALLSAMFFPMTLLFGGATGFAIWISLIAASNLLFVWSWRA
ncbi:hypothetical protein N9M66_05655, partial [Litoreibacter sp.]|nr:hypothetical protein [Litoreibacter sp.]